MSIADLNSAILKKAGFSVQQSSTRTSSGGYKVSLEAGAKGRLGWLAEAAGKIAGERTDQKSEATTHKPLEIDLADVNDVISALKQAECPTFIVLEDFHYLPIETQSSFSISLKLFHEESDYCFIVVGVWRESNRLIYFNGDLASRVVAIDADKWEESDLLRVIEKGAEALNISFDNEFKYNVVKHSHSAVYLVQEACLKVCRAEGIDATQDIKKTVGIGVDASELIKAVVDEQAGRYATFMQSVSEGFHPTELQMYKWLLRSVLDFQIDALANGLRRQEIASALKDLHPEGSALNEGNITQALSNIASLQVKKGVRPIIMDYDQTNKILNIVDKAFLVWLSHQDRTQLNEDVEEL